MSDMDQSPDSQPQATTPNSTPPNKKSSSWASKYLGYILGIVIGVAAITGFFAIKAAIAPVPPTPTSLSKIIAETNAGKVAKVNFYDDSRTLVATMKDGSKQQSGYPLGYGRDFVNSLHGKTVIVSDTTPASNPFLNLLLSMIPMLLLLAGMAYLLKTTSFTGKFSKLAGGKDSTIDIPTTTFADVAGMDEVVEEMEEVVDFLHNPAKYETAGARVPHGFLLVGPPGTGKTLLARAIAGEANVPFYALSGSDFVETFVGVGASRVRKVFADARKNGKAIIFIDELDAVGRSRSSGSLNAATDETDRTLNALLVEMDGFATSSVIVLAATNRPEVLDDALLRPGRFDRRVMISAPDRRGRSKILELTTKHLTLGPEVDLDAIARRTSSMTGADIAFLVNEAALEAARTGSAVVRQSHLDHAVEVVALGRARTSLIVSDHERNITAWHEAGHAVAAACQPEADDPVRVSIIPRGEAGGVTWMGGEDRHFMSRSRAHAQLVTLMAGRAGEMVLVGDDYTSGAASDLRVAGSLATAMVRDWGMSDMGPLWRTPSGHDDKAINEAVDRLLATALADAQAMLTEHRDLHAAVATALLEDDTIDFDRIESLRQEKEGVTPQAS